MYEKEYCLCIEPDNELVATWNIVVTESTTIHRISLKAKTHHVTVKIIVNLEARLPIPIGDKFVYIKDVVDTMVPWPKHLVFLSTAPKVKIILL